MNYDNIKSLLSQHKPEAVNTYLGYLAYLYSEFDKKKSQSKNAWWMDKRNDEYYVNMFSLVAKDGLEFDGKHVTLQNNGISYDVVAYKNKMLNLYPESLFDVQLVREGDKFSFSKVSGKVDYQHEIVNPFGDSEIIGAYCVIINKRGEFLTTLSRTEIDKHRKIAKTDYIWQAWFNEMSLKTVIKKACKQHFSDIYSNMETMDNEQYDLDQPLGISIETKQAIEAIDSPKELMEYYNEHKDANAGILEDFTLACTNRKGDILKLQESAKNDTEQSNNDKESE